MLGAAIASFLFGGNERNLNLRRLNGETKMFQIKGPVLAAAAFDEVSEEIIRQADALARFYHAELCVCHVLAEICAVRPLFPYLHLDDALKVADLEAAIRKALQKAVHTATSRDAAHYSIAVEQGTVHSGILRLAERIGAGAIVIGGKKEKSIIPALSGTAESVTRHAHCPVLVVRPSPTGKVLAATDFSDPSRPAIAAGASEANRLHTGLAIIHAIDMLPPVMPPIEGIGYPVFPLNVQTHIREASQRELDACVRRYDARGGSLLREGPAAEAILDAAEKLPAQLIVVGTHGRTGLSRIALGSVAEAAMRASPCSVLVVRIS
jgi:nucleotide-binding universal stress UspA family protein